MIRKHGITLMLMLCIVGLVLITRELRFASASPYTNVDVDTAYNMITNGSYPDLIVLDVRAKGEYDSGHIYGTTWIPVAELESRIGELASHKEHEIIVYCLSGGRSVTASNILDSNNFTKVYNMLGGITAWQSSGYQVWIATVHNLNSTYNYDTIQAAIDDLQTMDGHTILVDQGLYYEQVVVNKSVSLIGQNRSTTIIDGSGNGTVVTISKDDVNVIDFTVQNSGGPPERGFYLDNVNNCSIIGNIIINNQFGIRIWNSSNNNTISENNITSNQAGIYLYGSSNIITGNNVFDNYYGISLYASSSDNIISGNNIENRGYGISFYSYSSNNTISSNNITSHFGGLYFDRSSNNSFYHNNIIDNNDQVILDDLSNNVWDNGIEGNYWNDYSGIDVDGGGDGLGDSPYIIDVNNTDNHPLMGPVTFFDAGTWNEKAYYVHTVSNSTTSDFNFNVTRNLMTFNVIGLNGTLGFCRVAIPRELLWCSDIFDWTVIVNGTLAIPLRIQEHAEDTYLYFTYSHSVQTVEVYGTQVIPEFPSILILTLFMIITLPIVTIGKRKRRPRN